MYFWGSLSRDDLEPLTNESGPMLKNKAAELHQYRTRWFTDVSAAILDGTGPHPALTTGLFRRDLGDVDLLRAALVVHIACRLTSGEDSARVVDWLRPRKLFGPLPPADSDLESLVRLVSHRLEHRCLWSDAVPAMSGVRPGELTQFSSCLIKYWTSQRGTDVPRARLEREVSAVWGLGMPELVEAWTARPANPFAHVLDVFDVLVGEEPVVANLAVMCLSHDTVYEKIDRWTESLSWDGLALGHLFSFGRDLHQLRGARTVLERFAASSAMPEEARPFAQRVRELMDEQRARQEQALGDLTSHEIILLGAPDVGRTS